MTDHTDHKNSGVLITNTCGGNQTQIHYILVRTNPALKHWEYVFNISLRICHWESWEYVTKTWQFFLYTSKTENMEAD